MLKSQIERITTMSEEESPVKETRLFLMQVEISAVDNDAYPSVKGVHEYIQNLVEGDDDLNEKDNRWVFTRADVVDYPPSQDSVEDQKERADLLIGIARDWITSAVDFVGATALSGVIGHKLADVVKAVEFIAGVFHLMDHQTDEVSRLALAKAMLQKERGECCDSCRARMGLFDKEKGEDPEPN